MIIYLSICYSYSQDVIEILYKPLSKDFVALADSLVEIDKSDDNRSIELCLNALERYSDPYVRYDLIFWELSFHYANQNQFDKCFEILKTGQNEGLYYFFRDNGSVFPPYLKELKNNNQYQLFIERNNFLKDSAKNLTKTEYMIQLPDNYDKTEKYGLFIVMHGGVGSIQDMQYYYNSPKLQHSYIIAFFQGSLNVGSFMRRFSRDHWQERIKKGYEQITQSYPIDTNNIILAGPSAGGYCSIILGLKNIIPATGLLLSFAVIPNDLDSTVYINSAKSGMKIAVLCGENDWGIKQQKEFGNKLDKYGIPNRFVVFPEKGHEFPDNWPYHLDTSIEFILKKE